MDSKFWIYIILVAALTEWADGYLARKWDVVSKLGTYLDPIADKTLLTILVFTYLSHNMITLWELLLVGLRDLTILSGCLWLIYKKQWERFSLMEPVWSGKVATLVQYFLFLSISVLFTPHPLILWITIATSAWSSSHYIKLFLKQGKEYKTKQLKN